jgi:DNA primase
MPRFFPNHLLRQLRNQVSFPKLFAALRWPHKRRGDQWAFLCPHCNETTSAVNPRTNLARCFHCETNFNPIDFTMAVQHCSFVEAVHYLEPHLPRHDERSDR